MKILDTTLRDGLQGVGLSLSVSERLQLARLLAESGIHYIEAGYPQSNEQTREFLSLLESEPFGDKICLFGSTCKKGEDAEQSAALLPLARSPFPTAVVVGKTWPLHIKEVLETDKAENLRMIADSVQFLISQGKRVIYDAEHFFEGWREDPDYALLCLEAAKGAEWITLCDTNGASLPGEITEATREAKTLGLPIGVHCHNDCELAVANSLAAVEAGAGLVQGTINGVGERCGNANLVSIIADLQLRLGYDVVSNEQLRGLVSLSRKTDELLNLSPNPRQPFVGSHAFSHKGGMHAAGMERNRETFEHIDPEVVGNVSSVTVSEVSGKSSLRQKAKALEIDLSESDLEKALEEIKRLEGQGYLFESAEASLHLLLEGKRAIGIKGFQTKTTGEKSWADVTVKCKDKETSAEAEGDGPVEALDRAVRKALKGFSEIEEVRLSDYKVHIIDTAKGTGATTRVLLQATDDERTWTTIGVSPNIIEASARALEDSYNYALLRRKHP